MFVINCVLFRVLSSCKRLNDIGREDVICADLKIEAKTSLSEEVLAKLFQAGNPEAVYRRALV